MEVESTRKAVNVTWDTTTIDGELCKLHCVNPANGDVSETGVSKNDGAGVVTYPQGFTGTTVITVLDNHGNADSGAVEVTEDDAQIVEPGPDDPHPEHPIVLPPEEGWPEPPVDSDAHPEHPIYYPPNLGYNPPDSEFPPHPEPN